MSSNADEDSGRGSEHPPRTPGRRGFFEFATAALALLLGVGPLALGVFAFVDPLTRKRRKPLKYRDDGEEGEQGFVRVAPLASMPIGGPPRRIEVIEDKTDGWNFMPDQPIGAIFVQRTADRELRVFQSTCPHLGCSVSVSGEAYVCPCHNSSFELSGAKRVAQSGRENPSPRDLDKLEYRIRDGDVWVKYLDFYTGKSRPIPKT